MSATAIVVGIMLVSAIRTDDSTFVKFATADRTPAAWSPRGQTIAFASNRRGGGLFLISQGGTHPRRLTAVAGWYPSWSPDATKLAFAADDGLYLISARGGAARRLFKSTRDRSLDAPAWFPDGRAIAFERELSDLCRAIYVIPANGGTARRLAPPALEKKAADWSIAAVAEQHPAWSPDGRRIAYISSVNLTGAVDDPTESVMVMNPDGSSCTNRGRIAGDGAQPRRLVSSWTVEIGKDAQQSASTSASKWLDNSTVRLSELKSRMQSWKTASAGRGPTAARRG